MCLLGAMTVKVVYVYGKHCPACVMTRPAFNHLKDFHPEWVYIEKDADEVMDTLISRNVEVVPVFLVYKDDVLIGHIEGSHRVKSLVDMIEGMEAEWL